MLNWNLSSVLFVKAELGLSGVQHKIFINFSVICSDFTELSALTLKATSNMDKLMF